MLLTKEHAYRILEKLPESFSVECLIDQLVFIAKIEKGLEQSQRGEINTKEQIKNKLSKWLK